MVTDGLWIVLIGGEPTQKAAEVDPWAVRRMEWIAFSSAITEAEYVALMADYESRDSGHPLVDPKAPVDWRQGKPLF